MTRLRLLALILTVMAATWTLGQDARHSDSSSSMPDSPKMELDHLEKRFRHSQIEDEAHSEGNIAKARKAAEVAGASDDRAFVRTFDSTLLALQPRHVLDLRPNQFTNVRSILVDSVRTPPRAQPTTASIFDDPRYHANARRLITSSEVKYYPASIPDRITGGFPDDNDEHPACVAVGSEQEGYCCTGTLIFPNVVLTAGHCYRCCNESNGGIVHFGKKAYGPGRTVKVKKAI